MCEGQMFIFSTNSYTRTHTHTHAHAHMYTNTHKRTCIHTHTLTLAHFHADTPGRLMKLFEPHAYGQALAGAGGGGFMYVITREPAMQDVFEELIQEHFPGMGVCCYDVELDTTGLVVTEDEE